MTQLLGGLALTAIGLAGAVTWSLAMRALGPGQVYPWTDLHGRLGLIASDLVLMSALRGALILVMAASHPSTSAVRALRLTSIVTLLIAVAVAWALWSWVFVHATPCVGICGA